MESNVEIVVEATEHLKSKSKGRYFENIAELCQTKHGRSNATTSEALEEAIKQKKIFSSTVNGKLSYRKCVKKICIEDDSESRFTQTDPLPIDDRITMEDFDRIHKAPKTVETVDCECQTDPVDSCEDDRLKNNTGMADLNQQKLYEVPGQLSFGVTESNRILHEERTKSQTLLEENFKLKFELRAKEENTDTLSTSNKEIQDHKDTTESVIVQTEKGIVSPQKSAKRKNKKRRGRSIVNKSTTNAEDKTSNL